MGFFNKYPYLNYNDLNLDWVISEIKKKYETDDQQNEEIAQLLEDVAALEAWKDAVNDGNYSVAMANSIKNYIIMYGIDLIGELATPVAFTLENGYFVAEYPETWNDVTFNTTGYDITEAGYNYGHLVLTY